MISFHNFIEHNTTQAFYAYSQLNINTFLYLKEIIKNIQKEKYYCRYN